jgi:hypothetical protein
MATPTHFKIVGIWLNDLFALVAGQPIEAQAKAKIATVAALLAEDFPHETTFGRESLVAMAREFKFFPAYSELVDRLNAWWTKNKPASASLPGEKLDMPASDRAMVMFWNQYKTGERKFDQNVTMKGWLAMIRNPAPAAFDYLIRTDNLAAEIAIEAGWETEKRQGDPSDEEKAYVSERVRDCLGASTRTFDDLKSTIAPDAMAQHVPPQPPVSRDVPGEGESALDKAKVQFESKHGRKPGQVSPEQLEAVRQRANGPRVAANDPKPSKSHAEPTNFFEL